MGDLKALLERVKSFEGEDDEKKMKRIATGKMTIDDLYYQLEQMNKKNEDYKNQIMYLQADFQNYRKQVEKEFKEQRKFGQKEIKV